MHRTSQTRGARFGRSGRWGEVAAQDRHRGWRPSARQLLVGSGFVSLLWFLIRVLPKPSRAAYPCQRAAAPLASAFVVWLLAAMGSWAAWKKARELFRRNRGSLAWVCAAGACVGGLFVLSGWPGESLRADPPVLHGPLGAGRGVHPGRVVWVHGPDSTDWDGYDSPEPWWQTNHTDLAVVEEMMSLALRRLTGEATDAAAWQALFLDFNRSRDGNSRPYRSGEKIAIKINLTTCSARGDEVDPVTYEKKAGVMNRIDNSPQMILALLRQLVFVARVPAGDIAVGDPTGLFPKYMYDFLATEFPEIGYFDNRGGMGRRRTEFSDRPFGWSTAAAQDKLRDFIPVPFAEADYLINFALLKGHQCGVTLCAKNHYGSLLRCPDGYSRETGDIVDYYDFHAGLAGIGGPLGYGHYRPLVDLMGHRDLGGKTILYLIDGLFGGYYWEAQPARWVSTPFGDGTNGDWPSSLFASQDPVAIDSVAYDFLLAEWPRVVTGGSEEFGALLGGEQDYLHEAALASDPPSGTFYDPEKDGAAMSSLGVHEHWNNPTAKQYSRNRGLAEGIELVSARVDAVTPRLVTGRGAAGFELSWPAAHVGYRLRTSGRVPATTWTNVSTQPEFRAGRNVVTLMSADRSAFYRLAK